MSQGGPDQDYLAVTTPTTSAPELRRIAATRPDLHLLVLAHPNVYPDLVAWIQGQPPVAQAFDETVPVESADPRLAAPASAAGGPGSAAGPVPQPTAAPQPMMVPQSAPMPQAPRPAAGQPRGSRRLPAWAAVLIGMAVAAMGGAAVWFFMGAKEEGGLNAYNALPTKGVVVDVSTFGRDITLVPIGPEGKAALQVGSTRVVGFYGASGPGLAGIDPTSSRPLPQWIVPIRNAPSGCRVSEETITCGEGDVYKVSGALIEPVEHSGASSGEPATSKETDEVGVKTSSPTVKLEGVATGEVPYGIAATYVVNEQGEELLAVDSESPFYGLPPDRRGEPWIISDGHVLIALSGNYELWSLELPEGSLEVNGFGSEEGPSWSVSSDVLLVGEPEGILALDTTTGEERWRIDAEVASWRVDHGELLVSNGSSVAFMEFPKEEVETGEAAQSGTDEAAIGEEQAEPAQTPLEDLLDATLEVPEECSQAAGLSNPATFSGGRAAGNSGFVAMTDASSLLVGGQLLEALAFTCQPVSGDPVPAVAVYGQDLGLWGVPDFLEDVSLSAQDATIEGMLGEGSALQLLLSGLGSLCDDCGSSGFAQVTMLWNGEVFVTVRIGEPGAIWKDPTNMEKIEVGPQLTPEDLANITLFLPTLVWNPSSDWAEFTFIDYKSVWQTEYGPAELGIFEEKTVEAQVNGEDYLFTSIIKSEDGGGGSIVGGMCAISMEAEATCAANPSFGTSFVWVDDIRVDGDLVTYTMVNGDTNETATVTQRFDGNSFTLVSSTV